MEESEPSEREVRERLLYGPPPTPPPPPRAAGEGSAADEARADAVAKELERLALAIDAQRVDATCGAALDFDARLAESFDRVLDARESAIDAMCARACGPLTLAVRRFASVEAGGGEGDDEDRAVGALVSVASSSEFERDAAEAASAAARLDSDDAEERADALGEFGGLGGAAAPHTDAIVGALADDDEDVRATAVETIGASRGGSVRRRRRQARAHRRRACVLPGAIPSGRGAVCECVGRRIVRHSRRVRCLCCAPNPGALRTTI